MCSPNTQFFESLISTPRTFISVLFPKGFATKTFATQTITTGVIPRTTNIQPSTLRYARNEKKKITPYQQANPWYLTHGAPEKKNKQTLQYIIPAAKQRDNPHLQIAPDKHTLHIPFPFSPRQQQQQQEIFRRLSSLVSRRPGSKKKKKKKKHQQRLIAIQPAGDIIPRVAQRARASSTFYFCFYARCDART